MAAGFENPRRLSRVPLSGRIYERIREDIQSGHIPCGTQLNEQTLAASFGVSRGPLREAMQRLIQEGLLRSEPNRGVFVQEITEDDLLDVLFVRETLESAAIRQIIAHRDRKHVSSTLTAIAKRLRQAVARGRFKAASELDFEFHRTLVAAAESERLTRMYATVQVEARWALHVLTRGYRSTEAVVVEHELLAERIASAPLRKVLATLQQHFGDPIKTLHAVRASSKNSECSAIDG